MTDQERAAAVEAILDGYTQEELEAAFRVVANPEHWKKAIRAIVPATQAEVTRRAVIHFTGSVPTLTPCPNGTQVEVVAAGYYAAIGA